MHVRFGKNIVSLFIATALSILTVSLSFAEITQRERIRLRLLDSCVYSEHKKPPKKKLSVKACKCAAKKAVKKLGPGNFGQGLFGGLTVRQKAAMTASLSSCKK